MLCQTLEPETQSTKPLRHWCATLNLTFGESAGRTRLEHCAHHGPLRVQRLFYPESGGKAHCYLLHPPGGVVLGDELNINVVVRNGNALVTTPSAGRFYTVDKHPELQRQTVHLSVASGRLEWLPQETILFNGVNAQLETLIDLGEKSQLAFWDVVVLGRPACGEPFTQGQLTQTLKITRKGRPLLIERLALAAGDRLSQSQMGMQNASTFGVMVLSDVASRTLCDRWLAEFNTDSNEGEFTLTQRGELLLARYLGDDAQRCREGFAELWRSATRESHGEPPATPRIWHT